MKSPPWPLLFMIAVVHGGFFFLSMRNMPNSIKTDSEQYLTLADNLRHHHVFSMDKTAPYTPELFRLPAYPFFLAAADSTQPSSIAMAITLQYLLCFMLVFVAWPLFYRLGGNRGAWVGTLFFFLDLNYILHTGLILTEALFTVALTIACCLSIDYLEKPNMKKAIFTGLAFGFTFLIKPVAASIVVALLLCSFKKWRCGIILACVTLAFPFGWMVHNWELTGKPIYTVQGGIALFRYPAAGAMAIETGQPMGETLQRMEDSLRKDGSFDRLDPISQSMVYQKEAISIMKKYPSGTLRYCFIGALRILGGTGTEMLTDLIHIERPPSTGPSSEAMVTGSRTLSLLKENPFLIFVHFGYMLMLFIGYVLFVGGLWRLYKNGHVTIALYLLMSVSAILIISCHQGYYRFRIPMLPFLAFGIAACFKPVQPFVD